MITCSSTLFLLASIAITVACAEVIPGRKLTNCSVHSHVAVVKEHEIYAYRLT
jgi:hypothetical protein